MRHAISGLGLVILLTGQAWAAPDALRTVEKVVAPGQTLEVFSMFVLDPTCHSRGAMRIGLLEQPSNGDVNVGEGRRYPQFSTLSALAKCNGRKVPTTIVTYRPRSGYTGEDRFAMEYIGPRGNVGRVRYAISVR